MTLERDFDLEYEHEIAAIERERAKPSIDYIDTAPNPITVQIPLVEYFERIKRHQADDWQKDFCERLQTAAVNRVNARNWALYHAEAQLGKTTILSQAFPAWLFGHDPLFRFALAMYNVSRSQTHSKVVIQILESSIHQQIFPNKEGYPSSNNVSVAGWMTNARREINDGQDSFNPVGLQSGLTGSGFDWLSIDDPYKEAKEAFSSTVRDNMARFWEYTVMSRAGQHSNITGMFHRYAPEDFAGFLLDTGDFDYIRYATQADGDYIHEETGKRYQDPLSRQIGEYISPTRRPPIYYEKVRKNNRVWLSMFQGRPSSEEGDFFNVGKIQVLSAAETAQRRAECSIFVRSWDLAATEAGGDYSVGVLYGMSADGRATVFDIVREQVDTAGRDALQLKTAKKDGGNVVVTVPVDVGAGGKSTVFHIEQILKDFTVVPRSVTGSKEDRARNLAGAVNSGDVSFADDSHLPEEKQWIKSAKREMRDFPLSDHDDIVDAGGDAHNEASERIIKGLLITNYQPQRNIVTYQNFLNRFPNENKTFQIPPSWTIYAGIKISADKSLPTCAVMCARASVNSGLADTLVPFAEYKAYDGDYHRLFEWLEIMLELKCAKVGRDDMTMWLHKESEHFANPLRQKLNVACSVFEGNIWAGLTELNWYFTPRPVQSPFNEFQQAAGIYLAVKDGQEVEADDEDGLYSLRQEIQTIGFDSKGEPSKASAVLDCLRMVTFAFRTNATELKPIEILANTAKKYLPAPAIVEQYKATDPSKAYELEYYASVKAKRELEETFDFEEDDYYED